MMIAADGFGDTVPVDSSPTGQLVGGTPCWLWSCATMRGDADARSRDEAAGQRLGTVSGRHLTCAWRAAGVGLCHVAAMHPRSPSGPSSGGGGKVGRRTAL